jgi:hypothetical protein
MLRQAKILFETHIAEQLEPYPVVVANVNIRPTDPPCRITAIIIQNPTLHIVQMLNTYVLRKLLSVVFLLFSVGYVGRATTLVAIWNREQIFIAEDSMITKIEALVPRCSHQGMQSSHSQLRLLCCRCSRGDCRRADPERDHFSFAPFPPHLHLGYLALY